MTKTTEAVWNEIHDVTGPLEKTLEALAKNPNVKNPAGQQQADQNRGAMGDLNAFGNQLVSQLTHTQSLSVGMRKGSGSSSNDDGDRKK